MQLGKLSWRIRLSLKTNLSSTSSIFHFYSTFSAALSAETPTPSPSLIEPLSKPQLKTLVRNQYKKGKFTNLIQTIVASPPLLITACQNLVTPLSGSPASLTLESVSTRFDIQQLSHELSRNAFDPRSGCFSLEKPKGESLVLPNLRLKVVIEAIRLVLEIIYDGGFQTFVYGGRVGMGRHTAIRYLKNTVENPTWWFTVAFSRALFEPRQVRKLCCMMEEMIDDKLLIDLIVRLFESEVVRVEMGGCSFGRGLPQESGLCSILMNIYFNGFDKRIQKIRLRMNENPKVGIQDNDAFHKPVKIYATRYLDEILMITSGPKLLALDFKDWVVNYLEEKLDLKVDRGRTSIHSVVSEKIDFLGMELQAVTPSILHPPVSEKAKRAVKKHLRQKEVKSMELKNARERNRKKLGMKIFSHVFKKLKQSNGFRFEHRLEDDVRKIFGAWADEVVREFFGSVDERWTLHRELTAGDFLSLQRIRDQLPQELVDAYDNFQKQVEKYVSPVKLQKALDEKERKEEEEEERKYSERTVADLTKLCMKVDAPIELIRRAVRSAGFTNRMGRPRPIDLLFILEDVDIIKWYAGVGRRWLDFFCCCHNFKMVKTIVTYHLRFSCLLTLKEKHEATKSETIRHFTKDLKVSDQDGNEEVHFPTEREIRRMGDRFLSNPLPVDGALILTLTRLAYEDPSAMCIAHFCGRNDTVIYRIRLLQNRLSDDPAIEKEWAEAGMSVIHDALDGKCVPLCCDHIHELYMGRMSLQDIDCTSCLDLD